jgi:hypothetical protein
MEENLMQLISSVQNEDLMNMTLLVNDDLHKTM